MTTRALLAALLCLSAAPALASDPSPFYRSIYAVDVTPAPRASGESATAGKAAAPAKSPQAAMPPADGRRIAAAEPCACPQQPSAPTPR